VETDFLHEELPVLVHALQFSDEADDGLTALDQGIGLGLQVFVGAMVRDVADDVAKLFEAHSRVNGNAMIDETVVDAVDQSVGSRLCAHFLFVE